MDTLCINQERTSTCENRSYLFGLHNENWVALLKGMFMQRVSFVNIYNPHHKVLNNVREIADLAEVWFQNFIVI